MLYSHKIGNDRYLASGKYFVKRVRLKRSGSRITRLTEKIIKNMQK